MRVWVIVGLVLLAVGVTGRAVWLAWVNGSRGVRWPWVTWLLVGVMVAPLGWMEWRWLSTESTVSQVVAWVSGREDASAVCQRGGATFLSASANSGFVSWEDGDERGSGSTAWLDYYTCANLRDYIASDKRSPTAEQVWAVHVLTHEAMHVAGETDEARTECAALAVDSLVAQQLGASSEEGDAVARMYYEQGWLPRTDHYKGDCSVMVGLAGIGRPPTG